MISEQERPEGGVLGNENDAIAIRNGRNIPDGSFLRWDSSP